MAIVNSYVSLPEGKQYIPNRPFFPQKGTWSFLKLRGSQSSSRHGWPWLRQQPSCQWWLRNPTPRNPQFIINAYTVNPCKSHVNPIKSRSSCHKLPFSHPSKSHEIPLNPIHSVRCQAFFEISRNSWGFVQHITKTSFQPYLLEKIDPQWKHWDIETNPWSW